MNWSVVMKLDGNLERDGLQVSIEIGQVGQKPDEELKGRLPPFPGWIDRILAWENSYSSLDGSFRLKFGEISHVNTLPKRIEICKQVTELLRKNFILWLNSTEFLKVDKQLRESLNRNEVIQVLIRTEDPRLCRLPWHLWDFIQRYPCSEIAFSTSTIKKISVPQSPYKNKVRILAILGDRRGINVDVDRQALEKIKQRGDADVEILPEPERYKLDEILWNQPWDILFFAGHSETQKDKGRLYINPSDSLTLSELRAGLSNTIQKGLQIAIFNSCDGLGLARELEGLHIPQMIVMREPIPDRVAQAFATNFLTAFSGGAPFHLAERKARERLQIFENEFPCASWLPIIFQNPAASSPTWQDLCGVGKPLTVEKQDIPPKFSSNIDKRKSERMSDLGFAVVEGYSRLSTPSTVEYRVRWKGTHWSARPAENSGFTIKTGDSVRVVNMLGTKLIVVPQDYKLCSDSVGKKTSLKSNRLFLSSLKNLFMQ